MGGGGEDNKGAQECKGMTDAFWAIVCVLLAVPAIIGLYVFFFRWKAAPPFLKGLLFYVGFYGCAVLFCWLMWFVTENTEVSLVATFLVFLCSAVFLLRRFIVDKKDYRDVLEEKRLKRIEEGRLERDK